MRNHLQSLKLNVNVSIISSKFESEGTVGMKVFSIQGWVVYCSDNFKKSLDERKCGKWMFFFGGDGSDNKKYVREICEKAIEETIILNCKHSDDQSGVACFYLEVDDLESHKAVLNFFIRNHLIRKTKAGKLFNISFKLDDQTRAKQYGVDFQSDIKLDKFTDLKTGVLYSDAQIRENLTGLFN